jgi:hypothetical protein
LVTYIIFSFGSTFPKGGKIDFCVCYVIDCINVSSTYCTEMPVRTRSQTANYADIEEPVQVPLTREQKKLLREEMKKKEQTQRMIEKEEDRQRKYYQMKYDMEDRIAARAIHKTTPSKEKKSKPKPKVALPKPQVALPKPQVALPKPQVALPKPQSNMYLGYHWASFPWDLPAVTAARKGK